MIQSIRSFFANIRQKGFEFFLEWKIYDSIFSHLNGERDCGYPFDSDEELIAWCENSGVGDHPAAQAMENHIKRMPRAYGLAFRYIVHREIKNRGGMSRNRLRMYEWLARRRHSRKTCDPRYVATRAEA